MQTPVNTKCTRSEQSVFNVISSDWDRYELVGSHSSYCGEFNSRVIQTQQGPFATHWCFAGCQSAQISRCQIGGAGTIC